MPVRQSSNNRILPANARASDVAQRAIQEILPVQQSRNYSAHRVQGFPVILYHRLHQGRKCSCQASRKKLGTRLGLDGKASPGMINELISGASFKITPYGSETRTVDNAFDTFTSPKAPVNKHQGVFDIAAREALNIPSDIELEDVFGDNGPLRNLTLDDEVNDFDESPLGATEASCAICFGTGSVGGYAPFHAHRIVLSVDDVDLEESDIDTLETPWTAEGFGFSFSAVLPYGAIGLDVFRVMRNSKPVGANFTIDGQVVNAVTILKFCDGRRHTIAVAFSDVKTWTHVELQFVLSSESAYFEFPKLTKSSDLALLEKTEPFQISISSNVPNLKPEDIIVDSVYGKVMIVQNCNPWNTRNRDILGWECTVRVVQPQELYNILPRRGRVKTKPPTALGAHDNQTGTART